MLRSLIAAAVLVLISAPLLAASPPASFEQAAFARAQSEGRTIIIESYAPWCLPCRIQTPLLQRLREEGAYADMRLFRIGEKSPPADWRRFRLKGYGTLVVFKGLREVARGTPTSEVALRQLLSAGI